MWGKDCKKENENLLKNKEWPRNAEQPRRAPAQSHQAIQEARGIFSGSSRIIKIKRRFQRRMLCYFRGLKLSGDSRRVMSPSLSLVWIVCLSTFGTDSAVALCSLRINQRSRTFPRVPQHSEDKVQILQYSKLLWSSPSLFQQGTMHAHTDVSTLPLISNHPKYTPLIWVPPILPLHLTLDTASCERSSLISKAMWNAVSVYPNPFRQGLYRWLIYLRFSRDVNSRGLELCFICY